MSLYSRYYIDRQFERTDLFCQLQETFNIKRALYPGCFVHVSPSFFIPYVVYVDSDKEAKRFFSEIEVVSQLIERNKKYARAANFEFHGQDYSKPLALRENSFDLLISQWAGPISQYCKRYLKQSGILLANNSHADAGIAFLDPDYTLLNTVTNKKGKYVFSDKYLDKYFIPKKENQLTIQQLIASSKGIAYTRTANQYIFRKTN